MACARFHAVSQSHLIGNYPGRQLGLHEERAYFLWDSQDSLPLTVEKITAMVMTMHIELQGFLVGSLLTLPACGINLHCPG